jgi:hypothetical protein
MSSIIRWRRGETLRAGGMEYAEGVLLLMGSNGNGKPRRKIEGNPHQHPSEPACDSQVVATEFPRSGLVHLVLSRRWRGPFSEYPTMRSKLAIELPRGRGLTCYSIKVRLFSSLLFSYQKPEYFDGLFIDHFDAFRAQGAVVQQGVAQTEIEQITACDLQRVCKVSLRVFWA